MVTTEFQMKAAVGYAEAETYKTGNAFAKGQYGQEMQNAIRNALMSGGDDTSIVGAKMKLSGHFKYASDEKREKNEKGVSIADIMLLQQVNDLLGKIDERLDDIRDERREIQEKLEVLNEIDELIANDNFDPVNNPNHRKMMRSVQSDLTDDQILAMTPQEIAQWSQDHREDLIERDQELAVEEGEIKEARDLILDLKNSDPTYPLVEPFEMQNGAFVNQALERAAQTLGPDFDKANMTEESLYKLYNALDNNLDRENHLEVDAIAVALDNTNENLEILDMPMEIRL